VVWRQETRAGPNHARPPGARRIAQALGTRAAQVRASSLSSSVYLCRVTTRCLAALLVFPFPDHAKSLRIEVTHASSCSWVLDGMVVRDAAPRASAGPLRRSASVPQFT